MVLIVGLGNPGQKFKTTRHNIGYLVLDNFQRKNNFPDFRLLKSCSSLVSKGKIAKKNIILAKPQIFMNDSGIAVRSLMLKFRISISELYVVHDDKDIEIGKIKISKNRSSAGHNGVESVINSLKSKNFVRFRIGIKPKNRKIKNLKKFVLEEFNEDEKNIIEKVLEKTVIALEISIKEKIEKAMSLLNK